jgi:general secretion pathway protein B
MSILLDALKKSETQRQLGKTPTIHSAVESPGAERETDQQWIPLSMLALSAVAIAWFGWQQFREPVDTLDAAGVDAGVDVVAMPQVEEAPVEENQLVENQIPAAEAELDGMNHTPGALPGNAKKDKAGMTTLPTDSPEADRQRREKLSQSFNLYEAEKDTATDREAELSPTTVAKTSSDSDMADPDMADPDKAQLATNQSLAAEEAPVATPASRTSRLQPHEPEPISFWQLPQAFRDGLPEFRINVLVYAEKPEDRFLLINGQRLVEKEELIDGVVLDEIRRDGAVFQFRNYRFLVKG